MLRVLSAVVGAALIAAAWLAATPGPAYGCSCADQALAEYADEVDRAFVGRLVARTEHSYTDDNGVSLVFDVERVYKGPVEARIEVFTHAQASACGLDVGPGTVGIVAFEWRGESSVGSCSSPVSPASLREVFGEGTAPDVEVGGGSRIVIPLVVAVGASVALASLALAARRRARGAS